MGLQTVELNEMRQNENVFILVYVFRKVFVNS